MLACEIKKENKISGMPKTIAKVLDIHWVSPMIPDWMMNVLVYFVDHLPFCRWRSFCFEVCWWGSHGGVYICSHVRSTQSCNIVCVRIADPYESHSLRTDWRMTKDPAERTFLSNSLSGTLTRISIRTGVPNKRYVPIWLQGKVQLPKILKNYFQLPCFSHQRTHCQTCFHMWSQIQMDMSTLVMVCFNHWTNGLVWSATV